MTKPKGLSLNKQMFSRYQLLVFVLVFAGIGAYILFHSLAAPNVNLAGDLNGDNTVNLLDLSIMINDFGTTNAAADINGDGQVNLLDLSALISDYGQSYGGGGGGYTPTYYVSPSGSDSNNGTSPSTPWKTIGKVSSVCLQPGQVVAFQGGQTFSDTYLGPKCFGSSGSPIVFTSYGTGRAIFNTNIWMDCGSHDLTYDNLEVTDSSATNLIASGGSCSGNPIYDITVQNSYLHDTPDEALQCNTNDYNWTIQNNNIQHTGDSALILYYCNNITVTGNTITDAGWNTNITYAKHGIYSKSANVTISYNDFSNIPNGQAISIRTHGQRIYGNTIHDTPYAMAFFDYDTAAPPQGTTYIYYNRVWNLTGYAFYYDGGNDPQGKAPSVSFVIANNTFVGGSGTEMFNLSGVPSGASVTTVNNIFTGSFGSAYRGCATCTEHYDDWYNGGSNIPSGANDIYTNPLTSAVPALTLGSGSPAIDAGTTSVPGLTYSLNSDGAPLHYKGSAPDLGAVEH